MIIKLNDIDETIIDLSEIIYLYKNITDDEEQITVRLKDKIYVNLDYKKEHKKQDEKTPLEKDYDIIKDSITFDLDTAIKTLDNFKEKQEQMQKQYESLHNSYKEVLESESKYYQKLKDVTKYVRSKKIINKNELLKIVLN